MRPCWAPFSPMELVLATAVAYPAPYPHFNGTVAQALRSWPQYQQINWRFFPFGNSHYNALQAAFERRLSAGLQLKVSYTYSRLMNNGAETGLGSGGPPVQNPSDMRNLYSVSSDDVPHIFSVGWVYHLPFGRGKPIASNASGFLNRLSETGKSPVFRVTHLEGRSRSPRPMTWATTCSTLRNFRTRPEKDCLGISKPRTTLT